MKRRKLDCSVLFVDLKLEFFRAPQKLINVRKWLFYDCFSWNCVNSLEKLLTKRSSVIAIRKSGKHDNNRPKKFRVHFQKVWRQLHKVSWKSSWLLSFLTSSSQSYPNHFAVIQLLLLDWSLIQLELIWIELNTRLSRILFGYSRVSTSTTFLSHSLLLY